MLLPKFSRESSPLEGNYLMSVGSPLQGSTATGSRWGLPTFNQLSGLQIQVPRVLCGWEFFPSFPGAGAMLLSQIRRGIFLRGMRRMHPKNHRGSSADQRCPQGFARHFPTFFPLKLVKFGSGSRNRYQNGTPVSGNRDQNLCNPSCLILSHTHFELHPKVFSKAR